MQQYEAIGHIVLILIKYLKLIYYFVLIPTVHDNSISLREEIHIGARALIRHLVQLIWFGYIARLSQQGGGVIFLIKMISACLRGT